MCVRARVFYFEFCRIDMEDSSDAKRDERRKAIMKHTCQHALAHDRLEKSYAACSRTRTDAISRTDTNADPPYITCIFMTLTHAVIMQAH